MQKNQDRRNTSEKEKSKLKDPEKKKVTKEFCFKIRHRFSAKDVKALQLRGVSAVDILTGNRSFEIEDSIITIEIEGSNRIKKIAKVKQLAFYEKLCTKILSGSWLSAGISGFPSDLRAKQVAIHLFSMALKEYQDRDPRKNINRSQPLWHRVYGGFGDSLRDLKSDYPSLIVISNVTPKCSDVKLEKVRDILEKYNSMGIPVIVVIGGCDPYSFFTQRLFYPLRYALYLGSGSTTREI
jgi:hypothetical protein